MVDNDVLNDVYLLRGICIGTESQNLPLILGLIFLYVFPEFAPDFGPNFPIRIPRSRYGRCPLPFLGLAISAAGFV